MKEKRNLSLKSKFQYFFHCLNYEINYFLLEYCYLCNLCNLQNTKK